MLSRILAGLLVLVVSSGYLVESLFHEVLKRQSHIEMQEKIATRKVKGPFYHFTFTESEFENLVWHKHNVEFELNGHMYDVLKTENNDDGTVTVKVVLDKKESMLLAKKGFENDLKLTSQYAKLKWYNTLSIKLINYSNSSFTKIRVRTFPIYNGHLELPSPPPDNIL